MAAFLASLSALLFGGADFVGGFASRRAAATMVVAGSQLAGLALLLAVFPLLPAASPSSADLWWGAGAGTFGATGLALLYRALAEGRAAVVAPVSSIVGAAFPVLVGVLLGERPSAVAWIGVMLAFPATALIAAPGEADSRPVGALREAVAHFRESRGVSAAFAGVGFGAFFVMLAQTGADAGLAPLVTARAASLVLMATAIAVTGARLPRISALLVWIALAGVLDMTANVLFLLATRRGLLIVVAVITSLYPAGTVFLARVVLAERVGKIRLLGIALALLAVALIGAA